MTGANDEERLLSSASLHSSVFEEPYEATAGVGVGCNALRREWLRSRWKCELGEWMTDTTRDEFANDEEVSTCGSRGEKRLGVGCNSRRHKWLWDRESYVYRRRKPVCTFYVRGLVMRQLRPHRASQSGAMIVKHRWNCGSIHGDNPHKLRASPQERRLAPFSKARQ
ncbi:uncharacterized protein PSANT_06219 [Moesziomyces antarcticus]|uniref:Uncharacterized protein n=1 Tax=Pseudozyma antarctica TaxID=84753 RepID=A0A5C3FVS6_PSEA2|nr:uncharacterized protein PSANT_06219 [Moesziomyces antarcticus]